MVGRLANTLRYELVRAEAEGHVGLKDPDAIDLTMRGRALLWVPYTQDPPDAARAYFRQKRCSSILTAAMRLRAMLSRIR